jgi:hypothetical protein
MIVPAAGPPTPLTEVSDQAVLAVNRFIDPAVVT